MKTKKAVIVDYGMGNIFSIQMAIKAIGGEAEMSSNPKTIASADRIILPGVGAFQKAMNELQRLNLIETICTFAATGKSIIGICLGMQLLFSESFEFGEHKGLNLVEGKVLRFHKSEADRSIKIPQIGWNTIKIPYGNTINMWENTILNGVGAESYYYFVHSFYCKPDRNENILAETSYGKDTFCSVVRKNNIWGCQFHPERSAEKGLLIYKNFFDL